MNCLVVTAHPLQESLCTQLTEHIVTRLKGQGHTVVSEDLYTQDFSPALTSAERASYYAARYDTTQVEPYIERLLQAEMLVLVFPTWWFSFPAILKGWFDRVWGPGIAYDHASDFGPITPRLEKLQKVLVVTTLGAPWWVDRLVMWQPVKRVVKIALLGACARRSALKFLSLYNSEKMTGAKIDTFKSKVDKVLAGWQQ